MSRTSTNMFYLGIFLCGVCAIAAAIMGTAAVVTREPIENAKFKKIAKALREVLPDFDNNPLITVQEFDGCRFYTAKKKEKTVGYAAEVSVNSGYAGKITALISLNPNGSIRTIIITGHSETPGLGAEACNRTEIRTLSSYFSKNKKTAGLHENKILDQYSGHSASVKDSWKQPWSIKKDGGDAEYLTGATISSRAVNELAWKAASVFAKHRDAITAVKGVKK